MNDAEKKSGADDIETIETIELHMRYDGGDWTWEETTGEIIRCKDCIYQSTEPISGQKVCMLPNGYTPLGDDTDYCSMAERKVKKC